MLIQEIQLCRDFDIISKIILDICYIAAHGGNKWIGVVNNNSNEVRTYFEKEGFEVTTDKLSYLILTISWQQDKIF